MQYLFAINSIAGSKEFRSFDLICFGSVLVFIAICYKFNIMHIINIKKSKNLFAYYNF